jgi:predicted Ser/Thr protein kinase
MVAMPASHIGRYEILKPLGRGAMGVVYLARDPIIDRKLALKTLRVDLDDDVAGEFRERFLREARAAGRISHPGIVTIHDVGEDPESGLVFIAMEYIEGRDLRQLMSAGYRFRPSEAARIAAEVARALDYAHSMGVVHRDIKPANIILTRDGTPKITDFGIARVESSNLTTEGQFIGTPNFMAPEQITGTPVDGRADIFSLGVVLFNLLTGQRPFPGETLHEVTMKVVREPSPIPSVLAPHLPAAFNPIILKCLEKEPARRFQTAGELAGVLTALARSLTDRGPEEVAAGTGVMQPELATIIDQSLAEPAPATGLRALLRDFTAPRPPVRRTRRPRPWDRLPLPPVLRWEVNPKWVRIVLAGWAFLWAGWIGALALQRPAAPDPAPGDAAIRGRHDTARLLIEARSRLQRGDARGAEAAAAAALDQVPASAGARSLLARARTTAAATRLDEESRAAAARLVAEGRESYRTRQYAAAAKRFEAALELDPANELAASYLELARERQQRRSPAPQTPARSTPVPAAASASAAAAAEAEAALPTPGNARVTISFNSPIGSGTIRVAVDGAAAAEIPFDFGAKGLLGMRRDGTGTVKRVILVPAGRRSLSATLHDGEGVLRGAQSFDRELPAGSDWTLRFDLPSKGASATVYLARVSG